MADGTTRSWLKRAGGVLATGADALLVALFPPRCAACDEALAARPIYGLCDVCFETLEANQGPRCPSCDLAGNGDPCERCAAQPPPFSQLRAPYLYGGTLAEAVLAAKFRRREDVANALGRLLADSDARRLVAGADALVPVPLGSKRRRERGYNQSGLLARQLACEWGLPVRYLLARHRETQPQSDLSAAAREQNVAGAFVAHTRVTGKVVLVDDVVTSTETVRQAAAALRHAGADEVRVVALARAEGAP